MGDRRLAHLFSPSSKFQAPKFGAVFGPDTISGNLKQHVDMWGNVVPPDIYDSNYSLSSSEEFSEKDERIRTSTSAGGLGMGVWCL